MHKTFVVTDGVVMNLMREILFRGKRLDDGEWVYGSFVEQYGAKEIYLPDGVDRECGFDHYHVLPESVGQYTGLKDKNGTKIFEGDIVKTKKFNTPNKRYVIKYDLLLGAFIGEDNGTIYFTTFDGDSELFEVIGNIYDNPELMKGGVKQ